MDHGSPAFSHTDHESLIQWLESIRDGNPSKGCFSGREGKETNMLSPPTNRAITNYEGLAGSSGRSPALSNDSLLSLRAEELVADGAVLGMHIAGGQGSAKSTRQQEYQAEFKENIRPGHGDRNFHSKFRRDLSLLEQQLDDALRNQEEMTNIKSEKNGDVEVNELTVRLRKAEYDLKCSEEIRQADELEKELLNRQIQVLLQKENERKLRDEEGEEDLQRAVDALRASKQSLEQARAREQGLAQQLSEKTTQLSEIKAHCAQERRLEEIVKQGMHARAQELEERLHEATQNAAAFKVSQQELEATIASTEATAAQSAAQLQSKVSELQSKFSEQVQGLKNELSNRTDTAAATISKAVAALFAKRMAVWLLRTFTSWHALASTLSSKRAALATRPLGKQGLADVRTITRSWRRRVVFVSVVCRRIENRARETRSGLLRSVVWWVSWWSKHKSIHHRHCKKIASLIRRHRLCQSLKTWLQYLRLEAKAAADAQVEKQLREATVLNSCLQTQMREAEAGAAAALAQAAAASQTLAEKNQRLEHQLREESLRNAAFTDKIAEKDALIEAMLLDLKLVQAARQAEEKRGAQRVRENDKTLAETIARVREEEANKMKEIKMTANTTNDALRAQIRALMEREEERCVAETKRVALLQDMLHESQVALSGEASILRMRSSLLRPIARDREMGTTLRAEAFGRGGGGDEEDGGRECMSLGDLGKLQGADASTFVSRGRREVALMQALDGKELVLKQVQVEAARYRRERDVAQESWVRRVLRHMTWRCAKEGFERWCEALERVRHDKTEKFILEANEAAVREKDHFASAFVKIRESERALFEEKEALALELDRVKRDNERLSFELNAIRHGTQELMSLDGQVEGDTQGKRLGQERRLVDLTREGMHSRTRELQEQQLDVLLEREKEKHAQIKDELKYTKNEGGEQRLGATLTVTGVGNEARGRQVLQLVQIGDELQQVRFDLELLHHGISEMLEEHADLRNDKESLEIEVNLLRSEAERRPHVSLAVHEGVTRDNERLKAEFELLKNESMNLIALLGTLESPDPEDIPGCSH